MRAASLTFMVQNVPEQGVEDVMELNSFHSRVIARPRALPAVGLWRDCRVEFADNYPYLAHN